MYWMFGLRRVSNKPAPTHSAMIEPLEQRSHLSVSACEMHVQSQTTLLPQALTLSSTSTTTSLSAPVESSTVGDPVALRARVTGDLGSGRRGTVTFRAGTVVVGTAGVRTNGTALFTTTTIPAGTQSITATYSGNTSAAASTSSARSISVSKLETRLRLSVSAADALFGQPVALVARASHTDTSKPAPTGRVAFYRDGELIGSKRLRTSGITGAARYTFPVTLPGTYTYRAIYQGSEVSAEKNSALRSLTITFPQTATASSGLQTATVTQGAGPGAVNGNQVLVNYSGYLGNGTLFDSSFNAGRTPFSVNLGANQVIQGWEEGLQGIKAGETRVLVIPPALGYGAGGTSGIPGNSTLFFVVSVLSIT